MKNDTTPYRAERIREAIATRACELGIEVEIVGDRIVLRGTVPSDRRREKVLEFVAQLAPDLTIDDEMDVQVLREPKAEPV